METYGEVDGKGMFKESLSATYVDTWRCEGVINGKKIFLKNEMQMKYSWNNQKSLALTKVKELQRDTDVEVGSSQVRQVRSLMYGYTEEISGGLNLGFH